MSELKPIKIYICPYFPCDWDAGTKNLVKQHIKKIHANKPFDKKEFEKQAKAVMETFRKI